jgi:ATP-binding cassette subfamily F protein uup
LPQIVLEDISISFSDKPILNQINASVYKGDKIAIIGRNGEGKSTLMKIITGLVQATEGEVKVKTGVQISYLEQVVPTNSEQSVFEIIASGLENGKVLSNYQCALQHNDINNAEKYQHQIESLGLWDKFNDISATAYKFGLNPNDTLNTLSGGWRRRVLLVKALIAQPDVLLLDEPTNHLDIEAILDLEKMLINMHKTLIFISHDRSFTAGIANRVFDLDRGTLRTFDCNYQKYLQRKDEILNAEALANKRFEKKLSEEEVWIRKGIKARRTRNEGRVRALQEMRKVEANKQKIKAKVKIHALEEEKKFSKVVFEAKKISYAIGEKTIINEFSTLILKGDKIGIIGGNGVGKSTLIKLLLGELTPTSGNIRRAKDLKVAYFAQIFENLKSDKLVKDFIADGAEYINIGGKNKHAIGYLRNFLFTSKQALGPIKMLSGGEKNRLMLAKILAKPANILVLDEPTNDLDVETLELLEEMLRDYQGTLIVITHDREFLNNVVDATIVMDKSGITRYVGGYDDYLANTHKQKIVVEKTKNTTQKSGKISRENQKKLRSVMQKIEKQEKVLTQLQQESAHEDFYTQDNYMEKLQNISELEAELAYLYKEWEQLDGN